MSSPQCAAAIVAQLLAQGVRDVVLAPGSRSAPLALALARAESSGSLRLLVRYDERSAGFLALGLAKGGGVPVAVVTTSGTAVGNLLPAVMEAHHAQVPLVVISAIIPGMGAGALVLVLGFYAGSLALMTLAGLLLLGFGSLYYYDLGLTLMTKSWLLLASGALLLGTRQWLKHLHNGSPS